MKDLVTDIEKVYPEQLQLLQEISRQTFYETFSADNVPTDLNAFLESQYSTERLKLELSHNESSFYFALSEGLPVGYSKINEGAAQTEQHGGDYIELERIYVTKELLGLGIGKKLLNHAVENARKRAYRFLWLGVWEKNLSAINFYTRQGFTVFGEHTFYVGTDPQRDVLMRLPLLSRSEPFNFAGA